jgi:hypothetical protein
VQESGKNTETRNNRADNLNERRDVLAHFESPLSENYLSRV